MDEYPRNLSCEFSMDEWIKFFDENGKKKKSFHGMKFIHVIMVVKAPLG